MSTASTDPGGASLWSLHKRKIALRPRRNLLRAWLLVAAVVVLPGMAAADEYPIRPIRILVPFGPGTGTDAVARAIADELAKSSVAAFVENVAGANGIVGSQQASKAAPDGYTVLMATGTTHLSNPLMYKKLPYDPVNDFEPVSMVAEAPMALVVRPESPYRSAGDFVAAVQAGKSMNFGSSSGATRIAAEMLKTSYKGDFVNIPYKSSPQALTDLMGGQIDFMVCDMGAVLPLIRAGRLRALAVTSPRRDEQLPDVPTFPEAGLKTFELMTWVAAYVPAKTPPAVVHRLNLLLVKALATPTVKERIRPLGVAPVYSTGQELRAYVSTSIKTWSRVAREAGIEPE